MTTILFTRTGMATIFFARTCMATILFARTDMATILFARTGMATILFARTCIATILFARTGMATILFARTRMMIALADIFGAILKWLHRSEIVAVDRTDSQSQGLADRQSSSLELVAGNRLTCTGRHRSGTALLLFGSLTVVFSISARGVTLNSLTQRLWAHGAHQHPNRFCTGLMKRELR